VKRSFGSIQGTPFSGIAHLVSMNPLRFRFPSVLHASPVPFVLFVHHFGTRTFAARRTLRATQGHGILLGGDRRRARTSDICRSEHSIKLEYVPVLAGGRPSLARGRRMSRTCPRCFRRSPFCEDACGVIPPTVPFVTDQQDPCYAE